MSVNILGTLLLVISLLIGPVMNNSIGHAAAAPASAKPAAQAATYTLSLSKASDRSNPVNLEGQIVSGDVYVFLSPDTGAGQVRFYLDNPSATGTPFQTENNKPYDFAGGTASLANAYKTTQLTNGQHTITASIDLSAGGTTTVTATFTVSNATAGDNPPPAATTVPPTATSAPTNPPPTATATIAPPSPTVAPTATTAPTATAVPPTATAVPPTATSVPPTATVAPTSTAASNYTLSLSKASNRSNPVNLEGQVVSGDIYVFLSPDTGAGQVRFYLDNPSATGTPFQTEGNKPYDFAGGTTTAANPYKTTQLANGQHTITASIDLSAGGTTIVTATFTVSNGSVAPTATATKPPATATKAPTATATKPPATATKAPTATPTKPPATATKTPTATATKPPATATKAPTATPTKAPTATPAPSNGSIYWGVAMEGVPWDMNKLSNWERDVAGKGVSIVHWGHNWVSGGSYRPWSNGSPNNARGHGSIPMISWNPDGGDDSQYQLRDIINGAHDSYIRQFATDAKTWGKPFFVRFGHEMNGSWGYPWQEDSNGNQRGEFVQAWRHVVDLFRSVGATNASWVWCPNIDWNGSARPSYASLYPGDSYVDWTCLDGYNWGSNKKEGWQSFDQVFSYSYSKVLEVAPSKPMMLGEFGSVEQGGSKANWFTDALKTQLPGKYTRLRAVVYFNWAMEGVDWRVETSTSAKDAWRGGIGSSYYYANQFGSITSIVVP